MIDTFKQYDAAGFACLPTKASKAPDVNGSWKGGILDPEAYRRAHGIGIICGKLSGGLECLDIDNHFADAKDILSRFIQTPEVRKIYTKYSLPIESTVSGGFHLLYRCSVVEGNQKLAQRPIKDGDGWKPDTIIETRGEGGYFCAAPTKGYRVVKNTITEIAEITPDERNTLITNAKAFNTWDPTRKSEHESSDRPGDLFNNRPEALDEMKDALCEAGWKEIKPGMWQRPGKDSGISGTLGKVAENVFNCFTSNGHPFSENSGYTPFQVIGLLKYHGDFKSFAKELSERYKIEKSVQKKDLPPSSKPKADNDYEKILGATYIDLDIPVEKPPVVIMFRDKDKGYQNTRDKRVLTLGNFSAIIGKSKSKKTFLTSLLLAAAASNGTVGGKIVADFPDNKRAVLLFDTEQSRYDAYVTSSRIPKLLGYNPDNFGAFDLREYSPIERCNIIEYALKKYNDNLGLVVIDGIADLGVAINDEVEASRVVSLLMRWSKIYNCHIVVVIHQNKHDEYATGHLGSSITKKAEAIIAVAKNAEMYSRSNVSCSMIRGAVDFQDFTFEVNGDGIPEILTNDQIESLKSEEPF